MACRDSSGLITVSEERLWQFPEEGFEQAADNVEVLPPLLTAKDSMLDQIFLFLL